MNKLEVLNYIEATVIRTEFKHFHDVMFNGCKYRRYQEIVSVKKAYDTLFSTKHRVEWCEVLPRDPKHTADTVKTLSAKEVKQLGIEEEFLKANPDFNSR